MFAIGDAEWPGVGKLMEEAGEVVTVCAKLMGTRGEVAHWDGTDLRERLVEELADLRAAMIFVCETSFVDKEAVHLRADRKLKLFRQWQEEGEAQR